VKPPLLTSWDLRRFVAYEVFAVVVVLALPGYWVFVGWACGLLVLFGWARLYLRSHPQTPPPSVAPLWLTTIAYGAGIVVPALALGLVDVGNPQGWILIAIGFAMLADHAAERWWDYRTAKPTSPA
jgi:hypothetical protein